MKKTNKLWLALLLTVLVAALLAVGLTASAEETPSVVASGYCGGEDDGTNLVWALDNDGTLTISGEGAMRDYDRYSREGRTPGPWHGSSVPVKHLVVNPGVTSVGEFAFDECSELTDAILPEGLARIGYYGFSSCNALSSIHLPDGLTEIGAEAFACTGITQLTIPDSVTEIGDYAFLACKSLSQVHIGSGLSELSSGLFEKCEQLESIVIPNNITRSEAAFCFCKKLRDVTLSNQLERIAPYMFRHCAIESIQLPASVKSVGSYAFEGCESLKSFVMPNEAPSVENCTFMNCTALETVTIPRSVASIDNHAFSGCDNLKDVYYGGSASRWNTLPIDDDVVLKCNIHFAETEGDPVWSIEDGVLTVNGEGPLIPMLGNDTNRRWNAETQTWEIVVYSNVKTSFPWDEIESYFPEFDEEGNLILDGSMKVRKIIIGEGITEIKDSAFTSFDPYIIVLPSTLERIPRRFTHPHRPYATLVSYSAFNTSSLKDLYILNPDADMSDFSIKIKTRTPGAVDHMDDFYAWYAAYLNAIYAEYEAYTAAAITGFTGDSVLFKYYAAKHGAAVYDFIYGTNEDKRRDLDIRPEGVDAYIAGLLENSKDLWEHLGIPYDDTDAFEAAVVAYVNRSLGTDFASIDDMYVLQDPITEGGKPEAANSEALAAAVEAAEARMIAVQTEYGMMPDESAGTETEPQGEYYLGDPPEMEENGETIALTPPQDLYIHGYLGSTAEAAAAVSGLTFVPVCPNDYTHTVTEKEETGPTSTNVGHTAGWCCEDCGTYLSGGEVIPPTADHWGYCGGEGTNLVWTYDSSDILTISGSGYLPCFDSYDGFMDYNDPHETCVPWYPYNMSMKILVLEEGVTGISLHNFCGCPNLKSVVLPTSLREVTEVAFYRSSAIKDVFYAGDKAQWNRIVFTDIGGPGDTGNDDLLRAHRHYNATGHTPGETVIENEVAATCTTAGGYDEVVYCTQCPCEVSRNHVTVDPTGHQNTVQKEKTPPREGFHEHGHEAGLYCKDCKTYLTGGEDIHNVDGDYIIIKEPTVDETGEIKIECSKCGEWGLYELPKLDPSEVPDEPENPDQPDQPSGDNGGDEDNSIWGRIRRAAKGFIETLLRLIRWLGGKK